MKIQAKDLLGLTIIEVSNSKEEILFTLSDGRVARMFHHQDCCEIVFVEEIIGDLNEVD